MQPARTAKASQGEPSLSAPTRSSSDLRAPCAEWPWQPTVLLLLLSPWGAGGGGKDHVMRESGQGGQSGLAGVHGPGGRGRALRKHQTPRAPTSQTCTFTALYLETGIRGTSLSNEARPGVS